VLRRRARHRHADPAGLSRRPIAALLAALLAGSVGAGCGGDDGGSGAVTVATEALVPSKPDYISQADGFCAFYESRVEELGRTRFRLNAKDFKVLESGQIVFRPGHRPPDAEIEDFVLNTAVPNFREELEEVRSLTPPRGDEQRVAAIYDAVSAAVDQLEANPQSFADDEAVRRTFAEARRVGRAYGLRECGL
jgi:hypothetical protein